MSPYSIVSRELTRVLLKKQFESRQKKLGKTAVVKAEAYIVSTDRKTTVHGLYTDWKLVKSCFLKSVYKLSIAMCSHISRACL